MFTLDTPLEELPSPVQNLSDEDRDLWLLTYVQTYEETGDERKADLAAWGAINGEKVRHRLGIKTVGDKTIIGGWAMLFTDAENLDLIGTYFNEQTQLALDYYPIAPLLYEHDAGYGIIGKRTLTEVYPRGVWMEHELHADHALFSKIVSEIERGVLFYSSDSISHVVEIGYEPQDGHLGLWFLAACSLTQDPAEPSLGPVTLAGVMDAIKSAQGKREAFADEVDTQTQNQSQKELDMDILEQIRIALGLPEGTAPEVILQTVQALADTATKMGDMNEEEREASKEVQMLNAIREALTEEDTPPNDEEILVVLEAVVEMLEEKIEGEEEEPIAINAQALKSIVNYMKQDLTPVTRMPYTTNPNAKRAGGTGERKGFGTPTQRMSAKSNFAQGVIAMCKKDKKALKALGYNEGALGGWLPDRQIAAELIELFYADAVLVKAGATIVSMDGIETTTYRKQLNGASARWGAAGQPNTASDPNFGLVELTLREAIASTRISNRLIKNSQSVNIQNVVINDLEKAISLLVDLAALRGTGGKPAGSAGREILGVLNTPAVTKTPLASAGRTPAPKDFVDAYGRIEDANVPSSDTWGMIVHPRTDRLMRNTTDTTGQLLPVERFTQGYSVHKTTQIPINLTSTTGNNTDCTEIYFGDWQYVIMGIGQDIEFVVNDTRFVEERETLIQAVMYVDVALSHAEAFQVLTNVRP